MCSITEQKIIELCAQAVATNNEAEIDCVLAELRSAVHRHIQIAKMSLEPQPKNVRMLERFEDVK